MKKDLKRHSIILTRRELQIMKVVWRKRTVTVKDVHKTLRSKKPMTYSTILTFMKILERKGALCHSRIGRAFLFRPILTRHQATRNFVHNCIKHYFNGRPEKLIADVLNYEMTLPKQLENAKYFFDVRQENEVA